MFSEAARRGQTRLFRILSEYPEYPEITPERHHQALFLASKNGHGGIVQRILEASLVSVNSRDAESKTPLICAAEHGRKEVMLLLLGQDGIDLDATDSQKRWNAEEWARHSGHPGLITLLQERRQRAV
jgi:ankyrin repeat protein